jgi:hypothetical protein
MAAAQHANARLAWAPALDQAERNASSTSELLDAWSAAAPYAERDPGATSAVQLTEARLRDLHPEALQLYDMTRAEGFDRVTAMTEAQHLFRGEYGLDPIGAPIERGLADAHLARAVADIATPDLASAARIDEHALAAPGATGSAGLAATAESRSPAPAVLVIVDQAYPLDIHQAMATAPAAARRAITAAPTRQAITAAAAPARTR